MFSLPLVMFYLHKNPHQFTKKQQQTQLLLSLVFLYRFEFLRQTNIVKYYAIFNSMTQKHTFLISSLIYFFASIFFLFLLFLNVILLINSQVGVLERTQWHSFMEKKRETIVIFMWFLDVCAWLFCWWWCLFIYFFPS